MDDNLYPRDGADYGVSDGSVQYYDQPEQQQEAEAKMVSVQQASFPIMGDIVEWFDMAIADCDRISNIDLESSLTATEQIHAWQEVKHILQSKLNEFENYRYER